MIGKVLGWIVDAALILMNIIWAVRYADEGNTAKTVLFCTYLVVLILLIKLNQIERILEERRDGGTAGMAQPPCKGCPNRQARSGSLLQVGGISGCQSRGAEQPPIAAGERRYEGLYHSPSDAVSA